MIHTDQDMKLIAKHTSYEDLMSVLAAEADKLEKAAWTMRCLHTFPEADENDKHDACQALYDALANISTVSDIYHVKNGYSLSMLEGSTININYLHEWAQRIKESKSHD